MRPAIVQLAVVLYIQVGLIVATVFSSLAGPNISITNITIAAVECGGSAAHMLYPGWWGACPLAVL